MASRPDSIESLPSESFRIEFAHNQYYVNSNLCAGSGCLAGCTDRLCGSGHADDSSLGLAGTKAFSHPTHACPDWELYLHSVEPDPPDPDALQAYWHAFAVAGCRLSARCWLERLDPDYAYALPGLHRFKISKGMLFDLHVAKPDEALVRLNACFDLVFMKGFAKPHTLRCAVWA
ncbi:MAG: hypothetical protein EBU09_02620 [Betaproteobacteria bacterium]|nr:hypothetical protein [Betaproteobacteria bacterium]